MLLFSHKIGLIDPFKTATFVLSIAYYILYQKDFCSLNNFVPLSDEEFNILTKILQKISK